MQILGYNKDPCVVYQLSPKRPVLIFFFFILCDDCDDCRPAPNSCALNCRAVGEPFYATLEPAVMDGTPCDAPNLRGYNAGISMERTDRWLCVAGQCKVR